MKRKAQLYYAGHGGKPVYVHGYLTDESATSVGSVLFEVVCSEPEPHPNPGVYTAPELPGGWMILMPEKDGEPESSTTAEDDVAIMLAAQAAGFPVRGRG